jgi:hypothetical protein
VSSAVDDDEFSQFLQWFSQQIHRPAKVRLIK